MHTLTPQANGTRSERKDARSRIYRALYGSGGKYHNQPWSDPSRQRPQDWSPTDAIQTVRENWRTAKFDDLRQRIIVSDIASFAPGITLADLGG